MDIIIQSIGREDTKDISFTVAKSDMENARELLLAEKEAIGFERIDISDSVCKVSIVGAGMINSSGIASKCLRRFMTRILTSI